MSITSGKAVTLKIVNFLSCSRVNYPNFAKWPLLGLLFKFCKGNNLILFIVTFILREAGKTPQVLITSVCFPNLKPCLGGSIPNYWVKLNLPQVGALETVFCKHCNYHLEVCALPKFCPPIKNCLDKNSSGLTNHFASLSSEYMQGGSLMSQHCTVDTYLCLRAIRTKGAVYRNVALKQYLQNMEASVSVFGKNKKQILIG